MKNHSLKAWLISARPWSFPASAMPILVSAAYLFWNGNEPDWLGVIWVLATIVVFHAAGNTWSDYNDYVKGVDAGDTIGGTSITSGEFEPGEIKKFSILLLTIAVTSGLLLTYSYGLPVLYFGFAGFVLTLLYPWMKYRALGDIDIFFNYSLLPLLGTSFVATGELEWGVCWLSLPVGLITVGILHANNMRDMRHDKRANIKTLAMKVGIRASAIIYSFEALFPFLFVAVCAVAGVFPLMTLFVLAAVGTALKNISMAMRFQSEGMDAIKNLDEKTAQLQLMFSMLLSISFIISAFLRWYGFDF
ncbi:MAG: prenyltransferase [Bacteroidales bacterium]|nr:prenyltransferase [Bacteroidales bacterium]